MAARAHRVRAMLRPSARASTAIFAARLALLSGGTFGGGGGGGVPRRFSRIHLPRSTGDVRFAYDVTVRMLPWPSSPPRTLSSASVDAPEVAAVDVRNAVVLREPLVDERVVRAQQIEHAAVLVHDALEEQLRFAAERLPQVVVEVREQPRIGLDARRGCAGTATARRSWSPAPRSAGRRACGAPAARAPRLLQLAADRRDRAADRRECCSRGRTTAATRARDRSSRIRRVGRRVSGSGSPLDAEQELRARPAARAAPSRCRARSRRLRRGPPCRSRAASRTSAAVAGPPIRAPRERRQDRPRARGFVSAASPAGSVKMRRRLGVSPTPRRVERPGDRDREHRRVRGVRSLL